MPGGLPEQREGLSASPFDAHVATEPAGGAPGGEADLPGQGAAAADSSAWPPTVGGQAALAWEEAWEEAGEVPTIAASFSREICSYELSHQRVSLEAREVEGLQAEDRACGVGSWRQETGRLLALAVPIAVANLLGFCINAVGVSFVGRLGGLQLSAAVLAQSVFNVTGLSALMGFTGTVDTLSGQAVGAGDYRTVGIVLQRALLVNLAFGAAIAVGWLKSEGLFLALGQEAELSAAASRYMRLVAPSLPFMGVTEACKRTLLAQGVVRPATVVTAVGATLSPFYNWLFISRLGLGLDGAALAVDALQLTSMVLLGGYLIFRNVSLRGTERSAWHGWSREALRGWGQHLGLAIPSVIMICCKWWAFEALVLMAGWLPDAQLSVATMGVLSMANSVSFMLVFGVSMAASVRVSNAFGAGCPRSARRATLAALGLTLCLMAVLVAALVAAKDRWVRVLTNVEPVIEATAKLVPIFALGLLAEGVNLPLMALLRGAGKQKVGALANIASYWLLAIPLAHHLAFARGWGLLGLWVGSSAANLVQAGIMSGIALRFDYAGEAARAAARFGLRQPLLAGGEHA